MIVVSLQAPRVYRSVVKETHAKEAMSWTPPDVRLMDQKGRASDRRTKRIARPRAKPDDSIWRSIWSFVRRRVAVAINPPQRGRWIKRDGRGRRRLAVEDVLLTPAAVDSLLELLVEFLVEFDRVRVDARPYDLDRFLEVDHGDLLRVLRLAERDHRGLAAQAFDIGAGVAVEVHRELLQVHPFEGHGLRVHLQDRKAAVLVRCRNEQDPIEASRSQHGGIEPVRPVRRADYSDPFEGFESVHRRQELVHDPLADPAVRVEPADVGHGVQLVEEDDAGRDLLRLLEDHAHGLLGLPDPFRHDLGALDGDEIRLGFGGDGLRQKGLAGARRAVQEDSTRRADPHPLESVGVFQGHLHGLPEFHFHVVEAAHVRPIDPWHLYEDLAHGARFDLFQCLLEVVGGDPHLLERLRGNRLVQVDVGKITPEGLHRGLARQGREVRPDETVAHVREFGQEGVPFLLGTFDRHPARVNLEDFLAAHAVGDANLDFPVETSGPSQGRIDRLVAVRCADHDDLAATREPVHKSEKLRDHASLDLARHLFPFRRDRVELVDEQDAGRVLLRLLELLAKAFFALSVVLRHDFRTLDRVEVRARLVRDGLRDQRLAGPGGAVQEHALRRVDAEAFEQLGMLEGELDHLAALHQLLLEPTDVFVGDGRRQDLALADGFLFHLDDRVILDLDDPLRGRADHHERKGSAHQRDTWDDHHIALVQGPLEQTALHEVLNALTERDLVAFADDWRDRDSLRRQHLGLADLDLVAEAHADIPPDEPIDPDDALALVFLHDAEELRCGGLLPDDLDDLADVHAERHAGLRVDPSAA